MRREFERWLSGYDFDVIVTVSLKQALPAQDGTVVRISQEDVRRTGWLLRDRTTRRLFGKKEKVPFLVFAENGFGEKRHHLHVLTFKPNDMDLAEYKAKFVDVARRLEWVHKEIDIRPIQGRSSPNVVKYSLKEGADALIVEASCLPPEFRLVG